MSKSRQSKFAEAQDAARATVRADTDGRPLQTEEPGLQLARIERGVLGGALIGYGDVVSYKLPGLAADHAIVIGTMSYGDGVVCVATEKAIGMPINRCHCTRVGTANSGVADKLRERFLAEHPGRLA